MEIRGKKGVPAARKALAAACLIGMLGTLLLRVGWPLVEDAVDEYWSAWHYAMYISVHEAELLEDVRRVEAGELPQTLRFDFVYQQGDVTTFGSWSTNVRGVSATDTHGIYYSPQDEPMAATDGDHYFRTRRLKKNWFWYEEHF